VTSNLFTFCIAAELSPPEPFESMADPEAEKEDEITKVVEVVSRLLNEVVEIVLKEEYLLL
jgi:hypothetical protein